MNKPVTEQTSNDFEGRMFLFEQPELLTPDKHGDLGLSPPERPYDFVRHVMAVPVAVTELSTVQKHMPVVFSSIESPMLLAVMGIDERNLFVDDKGQWISESYVPAYIRAHPFALASGPGEDLAVVIDSAAASISESPEIPFFENGVLSERARARIDLTSRLRDDQRLTTEFCKRVQELELITPQQLTVSNDETQTKENVSSFYAVDATRLKNLDKDTLHTLHADGSLSAIYAQVFSAENWQRLLLRHQHSTVSQQEIRRG